MTLVSSFRNWENFIQISVQRIYEVLIIILTTVFYYNDKLYRLVIKIKSVS